ncbi:MAG: pantetheine-phosphate adenylyltransferase [Truepera sp.]|nr:pantetheine-phosphate adenylyltransferase [Truepera sp.]
MARAVFPGSFDPLHNGHLDAIRRASRLFDRLTVAVVNNPLKRSSLFSLEERLTILEEVLVGLEGVEADTFDGLLVEYLRRIGSQVIIKSLRGLSDLETEVQMAHLNCHLAAEIETTFIVTAPRWSYLSSTRVKELASFGADVSGMVPEPSLRCLVGVFPET